MGVKNMVNLFSKEYTEKSFYGINIGILGIITYLINFAMITHNVEEYKKVIFYFSIKKLLVNIEGTKFTFSLHINNKLLVFIFYSFYFLPKMRSAI